MRRHHHIRPRFIEHCSPFRSRRLRPEPQERETGGGDNRHPDTHGEIDHDRRYRTGQNMTEQDRHIAGADAARRFNKGLLLEHQGVTAHQAGKRRDRKDRHRNDHIRHAAAHHRHHGNRQQDPREGEQHIADAHNNAIPPAFIIPGQQTEHGTDRRADQHRQHAGGQRNLRSHQHPAKNIAPERIHPKPVHHRRAVVEPVIIKIVFRIERRYPRCRESNCNQQQDKYTGAHRHRLTTKSPPKLTPRRAYLSGLNSRHGVNNRLSSPVEQSHLTCT